MAIRCKMMLTEVFAVSSGGCKAIFRCQWDNELPKEHVTFEKSFPYGFSEFMVYNPVAAEQLVIGKSYYFDISPVEKTEIVSSRPSGNSNCE